MIAINVSPKRTIYVFEITSSNSEICNSGMGWLVNITLMLFVCVVEDSEKLNLLRAHCFCMAVS